MNTKTAVIQQELLVLQHRFPSPHQQQLQVSVDCLCLGGTKIIVSAAMGDKHSGKTISLP